MNEAIGEPGGFPIVWDTSTESECSLGTAAMLPREDGGVVDSQLNVRAPSTTIFTLR